jgi:hypothetical protein
MTATIMGMVYGQPKRMKTSMVASAFPNALWVPGEGANAIRSVAENEWGFSPTIYDHPIRTLIDLQQLLQMLEERDLVQDYPAVCVDGMTALCDASLQFWKDNPKITDKGKVDKFAPYVNLNSYLLRVSEMARHIGVHFFEVAHEQPPSTSNEGEFMPGGPSLGSKKQVLRVPGWCDFNARAVVNPTYPGASLNMQGGLYVDPWDATWVTGDRNGVASGGIMPPNIREILRASETDYRLHRVEGLEWQDDVAEEMAVAITQGMDFPESIDLGVSAAQKVARGSGRLTQLHMRWAVQDGIARGIIRIRQEADIFSQRLSPPTLKSKTTPPPPPSGD